MHNVKNVTPEEFNCIQLQPYFKNLRNTNHQEYCTSKRKIQEQWWKRKKEKQEIIYHDQKSENK